MRTGTDVLRDVLILIEKKAYALVEKEYADKQRKYSEHDFDTLFNYHFAKLVIEECAKTVQDFVDHQFPASEYPNRLKRYFGVE